MSFIIIIRGRGGRGGGAQVLILITRRSVRADPSFWQRPGNVGQACLRLILWYGGVVWHSSVQREPRTSSWRTRRILKLSWTRLAASMEPRGLASAPSHDGIKLYKISSRRWPLLSGVHLVGSRRNVVTQTLLAGPIHDGKSPSLVDIRGTHTPSSPSRTGCGNGFPHDKKKISSNTRG